MFYLWLSKFSANENTLYNNVFSHWLTHWGRVTHICVSKLTIIGSDNGLSPDRRQAIIWSNVVILLIGPLGTNFSEILIKILTFSFKKMRLKVSSPKRRPFCLSLNMLRHRQVKWQGKRTRFSGAQTHNPLWQQYTCTPNQLRTYCWSDVEYLDILYNQK